MGCRALPPTDDGKTLTYAATYGRLAHLGHHKIFLDLPEHTPIAVRGSFLRNLHFHHAAFLLLVEADGAPDWVIIEKFEPGTLREPLVRGGPFASQ